MCRAYSRYSTASRFSTVNSNAGTEEGTTSSATISANYFDAPVETNVAYIAFANRRRSITEHQARDAGRVGISLLLWAWGTFAS